MTHDVLTAYFAGEKRESIVFIALGIVAIAAAMTLWRGAGAFRGAAWPLAIVAVIQIVVGASIFFRTDAQVASLTTQLENDRDAFHHDESARMDKVMASFRLYKAIEIALLAAGVLLVVMTRPPAIAAGVGLGLLLQASVMLAADVVAEHRGAVYVAAMRQ